MSKFRLQIVAGAATGAAAAIALMGYAPGLFAAPKNVVHQAGFALVTPASSDSEVAAAARSAVPAGAMTASVLGGKALTSGSSLFMADVLVGEKLKELTAKHLDRYITRRGDRAGVAAFYKETGYAPLWIGNGAPSLRATTLTAVMKSADEEGLDPANYRIPEFSAAGGDPGKLAVAELRFTDAVLTYARHAQAGRFGAQQVTTELEVTQVLPAATAVLKNVSRAWSVANALTGYSPPHPEYQALKAKLAELRRNPVKTARIVVPGGPTLKRGMKDSRVPLLRKRLNVTGDKNDTTYDSAVMAAVRKFQQEAELHPDGVLGQRSLDLLNGASSGNKIDAVIANMERWRWLPRDLGNAHVTVNIPEFMLKVVDRGSTVWTTRVVVGQPETPTPLVSAEIENILLNPTWHVPESIIYNEYLPALQRDPRILERMGLVLERASDGRVVVKQPPGEENALGQMKFNFPNRFQVYLHDTPTKHMFARARRAYSHGCMRVENPAKFGEVLLSIANPRNDYTEERLQQAWGGDEKWIKFRRKIPVHLIYMTAYVDPNGKLVVREDIYGYDQKVAAILKGDDRRMADTYTAPAPKPTPVDPEKRRELERYVDGPGLGGFLGRLFR